MINRIIGFFQSLSHFFEYLNDMLGELTTFVPAYIQGALAMLFFFAAIILMCKLVKGIIEVAKTILKSIFFFIP